MGRRGPTPLTRKQRILTGNPSHAQLPIEIEVVTEFPPAPTTITDIGFQAYKWLKESTEKSGILATSDALAVEMLCHAYEDYRFMQAKQVATGTKDLYSQRRHARDHLLRMLKEFGLTPDSRARLAAQMTQARKGVRDELDAFLETRQ